MEKQTNDQRVQETRKIIVLSEETRRQVDAIVLGSMGHAPAKERLHTPATASLVAAYAHTYC